MKNVKIVQLSNLTLISRAGWSDKYWSGRMVHCCQMNLVQ